MNNKEILKKAKELVELLEKQEETGKVELSTLKRGDVFQTTGKRKYKVLEQYGDTTKIISLDLVKENVEFGDTSDYKTSNVKKMCDTERLRRRIRGRKCRNIHSRYYHCGWTEIGNC